MKHYLLLLIIFASIASKAQSANLIDYPLIHIDALEKSPKKVQKIASEVDHSIFANIQTFTIRRADRFVINLYGYVAGQLVIPETHGVYYHLLISTRDYGENMPNNVFSVGPFLGVPSVKAGGTDLKDRYIIEVQSANRKITRLAIYLDKVIVQ